MKKVLIITYYWPPSGGAGVQRWLKLSKYLPSFGWEPVILTVDPQYASYPQQDLSLMNEISPGLEIYHTKSSTGIFSAYKKLTGNKEIPYGGFANEVNPVFMQKIARFTRGNFFLPDARKGWNRYALGSALEIIIEKKIENIITTSPPHSTQMIGLKLKKKLNIKWIADLRDPWSDIYYTDRMYQTSLAGCINRSMEVRILNSADRVISTCNATRNLFRSRLHENQSPEKIITVTNGFDPDDIITADIKPANFTITYLGTFAGNYEIDVLAKAIDYVETVNFKEINLNFIGSIDGKVERIFKDRKNVRLNIKPYVEHSKAMEYLAGSAALLLVVPSGKKSDQMIPGKLFEYLASGRPVIAIGPEDSDVAEILKETNGGRIFGQNDSARLGEYLVEIMDNFNKGNFKTSPAGINQYTRRNLTEKIAGVLNSI
jgi:glycosyltransferase involved in cell wall biosynthesis